MKHRLFGLFLILGSLAPAQAQDESLIRRRLLRRPSPTTRRPRI